MTIIAARARSSRVSKKRMIHFHLGERQADIGDGGESRCVTHISRREIALLCPDDYVSSVAFISRYRSLSLSPPLSRARSPARSLSSLPFTCFERCGGS